MNLLRATILLLNSASAVTAFSPLNTKTTKFGYGNYKWNPTASINKAAMVVPSSTTTRAIIRLFQAEGTQAEEETEAERLLRKARELRAAAEQDEQKVHGELTQKKAKKNAQTDAFIDELFFDDTTSSSLVDRLRAKRLGMRTLESIIDRLDERLVTAQGMDHVEFKMVGDKAEFQRTQKKDEAELARLEGKIDELIQAQAVLDQEFLTKKQAKGENFVAHAEEEHWGGGKCAVQLQDRIKQRQRQRSEQFQKRMEEFREAQRRKDDDDHKFKGYTDLGTLN